MKSVYRGYEIDDDRERLDLPRMLGWLSQAYWGGDLTLERLGRSLDGSALVAGAYLDGAQVGCLRVISDRTTFAWLCDVYVAEEQRGQGLARALTRFALQHPEFQTLRRWMLRTEDAHDVYSALGFTRRPEPDLLMQRLPAEHVGKD